MKSTFLKANFLALVVVGLSFAPLQNAAAKNVIMTGLIEAQYVCHDAGNRGATIDVKLSERDTIKNLGWDTQPIWGVSYFWRFGGKHYYTPTNCVNLWSLEDRRAKEGEIIYAWYKIHATRGEHLCRTFRIKSVRNGKRVWIQNGGTHVGNVTCVAKDGI